MKNVTIKSIDCVFAKEICKLITATLPEWFGISATNEKYAQGMLDRVSFVACIDNVAYSPIEMAKKYNKPYFLLKLNKKNQIDEAATWIVDKKIHKLNAVGQRASQTDNIYDLSSDIFYQLLNNQLLS